MELDSDIQRSETLLSRFTETMFRQPSLAEGSLKPMAYRRGVSQPIERPDRASFYNTNTRQSTSHPQPLHQQQSSQRPTDLGFSEYDEDDDVDISTKYANYLDDNNNVPIDTTTAANNIMSLSSATPPLPPFHDNKNNNRKSIKKLSLPSSASTPSPPPATPPENSLFDQINEISVRKSLTQSLTPDSSSASVRSNLYGSFSRHQYDSNGSTNNGIYSVDNSPEARPSLAESVVGMNCSCVLDMVHETDDELRSMGDIEEVNDIHDEDDDESDNNSEVEEQINTILQTTSTSGLDNIDSDTNTIGIGLRSRFDSLSPIRFVTTTTSTIADALAAISPRNRNSAVPSFSPPKSSSPTNDTIDTPQLELLSQINTDIDVDDISTTVNQQNGNKNGYQSI